MISAALQRKKKRLYVHIPVSYTHLKDFIAKREAPAYIANDGKQTPMRGHPVFIAQHATFYVYPAVTPAA